MAAPPDDDLRDVTCEDRAGFLFDHPCGRFARIRCSGCTKPICERHRHMSGDAPFCTACAVPTAQQSGWYDDSPYFYGRRHYHSYQSYWLYDDEPDYTDFTDSDGSSTRTDGTDAFESDAGAS